MGTPNFKSEKNLVFFFRIKILKKKKFFSGLKFGIPLVPPLLLMLQLKQMIALYLMQHNYYIVCIQ